MFIEWISGKALLVLLHSSHDPRFIQAHMVRSLAIADQVISYYLLKVDIDIICAVENYY